MLVEDICGFEVDVLVHQKQSQVSSRIFGEGECLEEWSFGPFAEADMDDTLIAVALGEDCFRDKESHLHWQATFRMSARGNDSLYSC